MLKFNLFYILMYCYLIALGVAFFSSLRSFRWKQSVHLKLFSVLLGVTFVSEMILQIVLPLMNISSRYRNPVYNCFLSVEIICYTVFFYLITGPKWTRKLQIAFIAAVPFLWLFFVYSRGLFAFHGEQLAAGDFFTVCFALIYVAQLSNSENFKGLKTHTEFWISIALILNYSCQTPFLGTISVLHKYVLPGTVSLLMKISIIFSTIMYIIFSYAYLCRTRK